MIKKKLSVLLALAAVSAIFCLLPGTALAEGETDQENATCYILNDNNERKYYKTLQSATHTAQDAIEKGPDRKEIEVHMCADEVVQCVAWDKEDFGMYIYENVTIYGHGHSLSVPVTGTNEMGVINANPTNFHLIYNKISGVHDTIPCTLTINNLTIYGGDRSAIFNESNLVMNNCTITRSGSPANQGGGIYNKTTNAKAYLNNCTLSRNVALYGAGFLNDPGAVMVLENCALSENYADSHYDGGGGGENKGTLYMNNCTVANNQTFELGGGLNNKGTAYILNCAFIGNVATPVDDSRQLGANCGGGIALIHDKSLTVNGTLYVVNTIFSENSVRSEKITNKSAPSDIGVCTFSSSAADNENVHLYNCIYQQGGIAKRDSDNNNVHENNCQLSTKDKIFQNMAPSNIRTMNGSMDTTITLTRPALSYVANGTRASLLSTNSDAIKTETTNIFYTYFNASDMTNIRVGYGVNQTINKLGDAAVASTNDRVTTYQSQAGANERQPGVVGPVGPTQETLYTVRIIPTKGGSASGATIYGDTHKIDDQVTVNAMPDTGYQFKEWQVAVEQNDDTTETTVTTDIHHFTVEGNTTLTPIFEPVVTFGCTPDSGHYHENYSEGTMTGIIAFNANATVQANNITITEFGMDISVNDAKATVKNTETTLSLSEDAKYLFHATVDEIPETEFGTPITAVPYVIIDGKKYAHSTGFSAKVNDNNKWLGGDKEHEEDTQPLPTATPIN